MLYPHSCRALNPDVTFGDTVSGGGMGRLDDFREISQPEWFSQAQGRNVQL